MGLRSAGVLRGSPGEEFRFYYTHSRMHQFHAEKGLDLICILKQTLWLLQHCDSTGWGVTGGSRSPPAGQVGAPTHLLED